MSEQIPEASHREIQELLGAYALDAVDKEAAALVEEHLAGCVRCSIEVAQHHEVAGLLANSGGESPARVWDGIASHLDGSAPPSWERLATRLEQGGDGAARVDREVGTTDRPSAPLEGAPSEDGATIVAITPDSRHRRWAFRGVGVVAAAAAVVAVVLGVQVHHLDNQVNALRTRPSLSAAEQAALRSPLAKQVHLKPGGSGTTVGRVTVVLTTSGTGFVEASGLYSLPKDQTYQLWGVIGGKTISLGLLGSNPSVVPFSVAGSAAVNAFAITAERAGGVVHTTNQPVVAGEVSA